MPDEFVKPVKSIEELEQHDSISSTPRTIEPPFQPLVPQKNQNDLPQPTPAQPSAPQTPTDNTNRNFKGQQKQEVVHAFCRKHWVVLMPSLAGFLLLGVFVLGFFIFAFSQNLAAFMSPVVYKSLALMGIAIAAFFIHRFFIRLINYYLQILIVTNFRIILLDQTLFLNRNRDSIDLPEIQDLVVQRSGIIKTLLNYGEIAVRVSSGSSTKTLYFIPNPEYFFRKINKTKREYITMRRLQKGLAPAPSDTSM